MNDRQASSDIIKIRMRIVGKQMQPVRIESMRQFSLGFALKCMVICCLLMRKNGMQCRI